MAGLTYVVSSRSVLSDKQLIVATATFDDSYPTGGEAVLPSSLSLYGIEVVVVLDNPAVTWSRSAQKLQIKTQKLTDGTVAADAVTNLGVAPTEVANASDQSAVSATLLIIGRP